MAVKILMTTWATKLRLQTEKETIETELIQYNTGVLQGDCLSLNLFVLSLNPLSYLLKQLPGYKVGPPDQRKNEISHLFYVDDLKTYAKSVNDAKLQLDLISKFSKDIIMKMGKNKCAYINIEKGKKVSLGNNFMMHETEMTELTRVKIIHTLGKMKM